MLYAANVAGLTGSAQIKVQDEEKKKIQKANTKPIVLTEDEAIVAL